MDKGINKTLMALVPILQSNGENIVKIEAVNNWFVGVDNKEHKVEVAEITYADEYRKYADINHDSNLAAISDVLGVVLYEKPAFDYIGKIERNVSD